MSQKNIYVNSYLLNFTRGRSELNGSNNLFKKKNVNDCPHDTL